MALHDFFLLLTVSQVGSGVVLVVDDVSPVGGGVVLVGSGVVLVVDNVSPVGGCVVLVGAGVLLLVSGALLVGSVVVVLVDDDVSCIGLILNYQFDFRYQIGYYEHNKYEYSRILIYHNSIQNSHIQNSSFPYNFQLQSIKKQKYI